MSTLQELSVTAGNTVNLLISTDTLAISATCSIVTPNLLVKTALSSTLNEAGDEVTVTIPAEITEQARNTGTILQVTWDITADHVENTRVNLVGVL